MEGTDFVSDDEILRLINTALHDLYDEAVKASENYFVTSTPLAIAAETVALPDDVRRVSGLDLTSGGRTYTLRRFNFAERNRYKSAPANWASTDGPFRFCIVNRSLLIAPAPTGSYTCTLWYIPRFADLALGEDVLFPIDDHEDYVVAWCAAQCLAKEESDPTVQLREAAEAMKRAIDNLPRYDESEPMQVVDIYRQNTYDGWY
jgi:hypothetical protein